MASVDTREMLGNGIPVASGPRRAAAPRERIVYRDKEVPVQAAAPPSKITVIRSSKTEQVDPANSNK